MRNKNLIAGVALAGAAFLVFFIYFRMKENALEAKGALNKVVTAKSFIPGGATITAGLLKLAEIPEMYIQPGALRSLESAEGLITVAGISENEQLLANKTVKIAGRLSEAVPIGFRAACVAVDDISGINGMIRPGDFVDVIGTFEESGSRGVFTSTVLQNVRVLALDDDYTGAAPAGKRNADFTGVTGRSTASLALEPSDAEILAFAESKGKLKLSLRNPGDVKVAQTKTTNFGNLLRSSQSISAKPAEGQSMEIIRGTEGEKVQIRK
ncbi:MAG: Flp pilus assembly protein CpaB [Candidatus Firestonebacteria bacterium]